MGAGYAVSRPPVHPRIIDRIRQYLPGTVGLAADVGCGAGLSTVPLRTVARYVAGIDPSEDMIRNCPAASEAMAFAVAQAEELPFASHSAGLITAAGSLNYAYLDRFFLEAARVLAREGVLAVYDFSPGRSFRDSDALDAWFRTFLERYPFPRNSALELSPEILASSPGFRMFAAERFEIAITVDPAFYVNYMMTETNVAAAVSHGADSDAIRQWCTSTLEPVFLGHPRDVLFRGYFSLLRPADAA